jgi:hypothetical protein
MKMADPMNAVEFFQSDCVQYPCIPNQAMGEYGKVAGECNHAVDLGR